MSWRPLLILFAATFAQAAERAGPTEFYVISDFFSDNGALFYYRVMEVKPDGSDSLIRYARIAPMDVSCLRKVVQAAEARVRNTSPAQLVKSNNPCAVKPAALHAALKNTRRPLVCLRP